MPKPRRPGRPTKKVWTEEELAPFLNVPNPKDAPVVGTIWEVHGIEEPEGEP